MEEFLELINKNCCMYDNADSDINKLIYTKCEWTEKDVLCERKYCCTAMNPLYQPIMLCRNCKELINNYKFIIQYNIEIRAEKQRAEHEQAQKERHEEMLKAMSVLAIKQTYQLEQLLTLTTAVNALAPKLDDLAELKKLPAAIKSLSNMIETSQLLSSTTSRASSCETPCADDYLRTYYGRSGYPRFK